MEECISDIPQSMDEFHKLHVEWKKSGTKSINFNVPFYMSFLKNSVNTVYY